MYFLCPRHRQLLARRPVAELMDLWLEWMHQAALCQAMDEPRRAVSFSGCAYDLMCALVPSSDCHRKTAITKLTLAAIYLARQLGVAGELEKAALVLSSAFQQLGRQLGDPVLAGWARQCMGVLLDDSRHEGFFQRYLNLPLTPAPALAPVSAACH